MIDCFTNFLPGRGGGDPHVTTLDERDYTFNGLGEYTLITTDDQSIVIQGRTELTPGTGNTGATNLVHLLLDNLAVLLLRYATFCIL